MWKLNFNIKKKQWNKRIALEIENKKLLPQTKLFEVHRKRYFVTGWKDARRGRRGALTATYLSEIFDTIRKSFGRSIKSSVQKTDASVFMDG